MWTIVYVRLRKFLIMKITIYFARNPIKLGGPNIVVQVDEIKLNHNVKAHRGRGIKDPTWVLTMADTSTTPAKGYAKVIPKKDTNTIIPIIENTSIHGSPISTTLLIPELVLIPKMLRVSIIKSNVRVRIEMGLMRIRGKISWMSSCFWIT